MNILEKEEVLKSDNLVYNFVIGCCFERSGILELVILIMIDIGSTNDSNFKKVVDFE